MLFAMIREALNLLAACAGALVLAAAGARLRRLSRLPVLPSLKLPVDFLAGAWLLGAGALALGLLGAFRPLPLLLLAGALAAAGRWRRPGWRLRELPLLALPLLLLLPVALAPPFFYDALVYHLALPWQALLQGRIAAHPEDLFSSFPPLAQMIYALPLAAGLHRAPALLHLISFLAGGAALAALARRLGAPPALALVAGATLPLLPALVLVPGLPAAEGWTLAALIAAFAVIAGGRDLPSSAALAGGLAGMALGARLQGAAWCGIVIVAVALRSRAPLRRAAAALIPAVLASSPWWLKNALLLHNPLAPALGWRRAGMESLWKDAGTLMYTTSGFIPAVRALGGALAPHLSYLLPLALAGMLAILGRRPAALRATAAAALLGLAAWGATGTLPRFLAPTLGLLLALSAAAGRDRFGKWAGGLALGCALLLGIAGTGRQLARWGLLTFASPASGAGASALILNNPLPAFAAAASLPPGARVLFVGEPRGFLFPRRFSCPSQHDVSPLRDLLEQAGSSDTVRRRLRDLGFTHLLINRAELARLSPGYPVLPWRTEAGRRKFQELLDESGAPVVKVGEVGIFALPEGAGATRPGPVPAGRGGIVTRPEREEKNAEKGG